jgi:hypothetical protein
MKLRLRRVFAGIDPGTVCTGTVHFFRLDVQRLIDARVIELNAAGTDYVFRGLPSEPQT